jgi:hypothetical protein
MNLCKIGCRIKKAKELVKCVPFFYAIRNEQVCDINAMLVLAGNLDKWYSTMSCDCPSLCETIIMTRMSTKTVRDVCC